MPTNDLRLTQDLIAGLLGVRRESVTAAAGKLRVKSFTLDGEAVVAGADGGAVFDALHRRGRVTDAILQAFHLLELDGVETFLKEMGVTEAVPQPKLVVQYSGSGDAETKVFLLEQRT